MSMPHVSSRPSRLRHAWVMALMALAALPGTACHRYVVVNTADPLYGARNFIIEPLAFNNLSVGRLPEEVYLSRKDAQQQQSWQIDKGETAQTYFAQVTQAAGAFGLQIQPPPPPGPGYFIVRPSVSQFEPGNFNYFVNIPTQMSIVLEIFTPDGRRVGLEAMSTRVPATLANPSSGGRMRQAGGQLGYETAVYLARRAGVRRPNGALVR
ncbi:MAG TPA: hypothetical protein VH877_14325 [Polyangia bacterium]|nr:hypothetical protein [Polyangia bacterium]